MTAFRRLLLLLPLVLLVATGMSQQRQLDRQPAVAGQFYPGDPDDLRSMVDGFLAQAV